MMKLASLSPLLAAGLLFAGSLSAQLQRLPGIPVVPPPVNHPALAGQPLIGNETTKARPRGVKVRPAPKATKPDPSTSGVKIKGKALKAAVKKVAALPWNKGKRGLQAALSKAKKSGKPVLLLQTLGDIDKFA